MLAKQWVNNVMGRGMTKIRPSQLEFKNLHLIPGPECTSGVGYPVIAVGRGRGRTKATGRPNTVHLSSELSDSKIELTNYRVTISQFEDHLFFNPKVNDEVNNLETNLLENCINTEFNNGDDKFKSPSSGNILPQRTEIKESACDNVLQKDILANTIIKFVTPTCDDIRVALIQPEHIILNKEEKIAIQTQGRGHYTPEPCSLKTSPKHDDTSVALIQPEQIHLNKEENIVIQTEGRVNNTTEPCSLKTSPKQDDMTEVLIQPEQIHLNKEENIAIQTQGRGNYTPEPCSFKTSPKQDLPDAAIKMETKPQETFQPKMNIPVASSSIDELDIIELVSTAEVEKGESPNIKDISLDKNTFCNAKEELQDCCKITPVDSPLSVSPISDEQADSYLNLAIKQKMNKFTRNGDSSERIPSHPYKNRTVLPRSSGEGLKKNANQIPSKTNLENNGKRSKRKDTRKGKTITLEANSSFSNEKWLDFNGDVSKNYNIQELEEPAQPSYHHLDPRSYSQNLPKPKLDCEKEFPKLNSELSKTKIRLETRPAPKPSWKDLSCIFKGESSIRPIDSDSSEDSIEFFHENHETKNLFIKSKKFNLGNIKYARCEENIKAFISEFGVVKDFKLIKMKNCFTASIEIFFNTEENYDNFISAFDGAEASQFDPNHNIMEGGNDNILLLTTVD